MKHYLIVLLFLISASSFSQRIAKPITQNQRQNDSTSFNQSQKVTTNKNIENHDAKIIDYLIISHQRDTTYVDTTLTLKKDYKFNYLRKDDLELMPFSNEGQTYNTLAYDFNNTNLTPLFGARARHFNYMEIEDVSYYHVPTPFTELMYKSVFKQGQLVDALFTVNTSKQLNFSIAYKGLRSLGTYQHILTSTGNFRFTTSYKTKNNKYIANAHFTSQDLMNQENGGILESNIPYFEEGLDDFKDRGVFDVNFENAESILVGKRFHLDHLYNIIEKDTLSSNALNIENIISFEDKYFEFTQSTAATDYFGDAFKNTNLRDRSTLENFYTELRANYSNSILGNLSFNANYTNYNYGYDKLVFLNGSLITNRLKGDLLGIGGSYSNSFGKLNLSGEAGINVSGDFEGNFFTGKATFDLTDDIILGAQINHNSHVPNYNFLLYQSDYVNYNWQNDFKNVQTQNLKFTFNSAKIASVSADFSTIDNYTYFARDVDSMVKPFQNTKTIAYLKIKAENEFKLGKFALNNALIYQKVSDDNQVLNVPEFITRNTLYYTNRLFKNELLLQTGITFKYFTKYYMNAYDPALAEFYTQTNTKYGNFPMFDFFVDGKIRTMRIYLKLEHFNASLTGYNYYSAPGYPYRDMVFRFGVEWNFFL